MHAIAAGGRVANTQHYTTRMQEQRLLRPRPRRSEEIIAVSCGAWVLSLSFYGAHNRLMRFLCLPTRPTSSSRSKHKDSGTTTLSKCQKRVIGMKPARACHKTGNNFNQNVCIHIMRLRRATNTTKPSTRINGTIKLANIITSHRTWHGTL